MPGLPRRAGQGLARLPSPTGDAASQRGHPARRLQQRHLQGRKRDHGVLAQRRRILGQHAGYRWQECRFQGRLHLWHRPLAAIPDRGRRRPAPGPRRGLGYREAALVSPLSGSGRDLQEPVALEQAEPERQLHVRRVPHHRLQAQFRCGEKHLRQSLEQPRCRLPGLPWPGVQSPGMDREENRPDPRRLCRRPQGQERHRRNRNLCPLPLSPRAP
ncbi:hypothetical protein D3C80_1008830 [compost metagenome]